MTKTKPDRAYISWVEAQDENGLYLSSITIGEVYSGIVRLADGKKRGTLLKWVSEELMDRFHGKILPLDTVVAARWGEIIGAAGKRGINLPVVDAMIAATALTHGLEVVTRNATDFKKCGVAVTNPWGV
ncbi:MAG: type II toxin-antitoxin system VapC family toxin [Nitrospinae bacterium]|nr:type II toxin-antitoxin system VapC family toxin [Nitrospinota bacterium]MBF0634257.1 type II toxin-antitoxin system VapC family toxin [Nitrospinota bacterium]